MRVAPGRGEEGPDHFPNSGLPNVNDRVILLVRAEKEVDPALLKDGHILTLVEGCSRNFICYARPVGERAFDPSARHIIHQEELDRFTSCHFSFLHIRP